MNPDELEFITIGKVLAPSGVKGKVKVEVTTDFPQRFAPSATVYIKRQPMTIDAVTWHKRQAIIKLNTIDGIEDAQKLRGLTVEIHHSQAHPLPEGQYYHFELIGLEVWTTKGQLVGSITEIMTTESNDVYIVSGDKGDILIPAIDDVVKIVDLSRGRITIEAIEGLLA